MKVGGQILWNAIPIFETSQICYLMGRRPMKDVLGNHLRAYYSIWVIGWVLPYNFEGSVPNPSIWKESFTWIVPRIRSLRGWNLEGWHIGCGPRRVGNYGRIGNLLKKDPMRKRWYISQTRRNYFPIADGRIKNPGGDQDLRTSTSIRHRPIQGESRIVFLGESQGSLPQPHDSLPDAGEAINDLWSTSGNFIFRHHVEPRVKLYSPREESSQFHWSTLTSPEPHTHTWMLSRRNASMIIGISMGQEICRILGQIHSVYSIERKTSNRIYVVRGEINKKAADIQARSFMARTLGEIWKECQAEGGKIGHMKNLTSIMHENCEEFISLTLRTRNLRRPPRVLARKLETPFGTRYALQDEARTVSMWWLVVNPMRSNQNLRVFWKGVNLQDCVWRNHCQLIMKTVLQEKENSLQHYNFVSQIYSCASSHEDARSKSSGGQGMGKIGKDSGVEPDESLHWWTCVIWGMPNWRQFTKSTKVELHSEVILWKTIQCLMQCSLNKDLQHVKWQQQKSWISSPDCRVAQDRQQTQYRLKPKWKWKMLTNYWKFQNRSVQTFGFVYHDTNGLNHGPVRKTQSFLLNEICMVILW